MSRTRVECEATVIRKDGRRRNEQEPVTAIRTPVEFFKTNVKLDPFGRVNIKYLNFLPTQQDTGPRVRMNLAVAHFEIQLLE